MAKLAGVPDDVVETAKQFLEELNKTYSIQAAKPRETPGEAEDQVSFAQNSALTVADELQRMRCV